ncbi:GntR family transcriptional regulator [Desulfosporosinus sp. BICA1-9]|uniref:GntR family transcriptional regulator n=1 Tax=Desulfosporosinus sp. BICA1-9 TaxID=1531958 RepID=UPI00054C3193|nr:GntR family transcriptional regulator [Desulfosporosinus sp. BICA1-9]KJS49659.1 MAG: transcriptional regulator [Peptococcaceae bacterium BRH_c23]KJS88454.1 MAG: transcriptional regulator [Desulfosporosinus sp. BICA1-9]HBW34702.1 GntR family transcriptional regulator [Desulfosporosinus sp.]
MSNEMEIVDKLVPLIVSGRYNPHDKLPSENEIADQYKVPRITARKAYERLEELGHIYKQQGKGSYVKDRSTQIELVLSGDVSFSQKMIDKGYDFHSETIFCRESKYNKKICDYLETDKEDRIFKVARLRYIVQQPIALHISYVAKSVLNDIDAVGMDITSMFKYYHSKGYTELCSKPSLLSVSFPTKSQRKLLNCPDLVPLLVSESGCTDKKTGTVLEYRKIFYRCDCFSYVIP